MNEVKKLAIVLIIFEGIIIQCEGYPPIGESSRNTTEEDSDDLVYDFLTRMFYNVSRNDPPSLPEEILGNIFSRTDLGLAERAVEAKVLYQGFIDQDKLLENRIVLIRRHSFPEGLHQEYLEQWEPGYITRPKGTYKDFLDVHKFRGIHEFSNVDGTFLESTDWELLDDFFRKFHKKVKKIQIEYHVPVNDALRRYVKSLIRKIAKNLEEVRISCVHDKNGIYHDEYWDQFSDKHGNDIVFPGVKNFSFFGEIGRAKFNMKSMFPNLEYAKLHGSISFGNYLTDITTLRKLDVLCTLGFTEAFNERYLISVFENNKNMEELILRNPEEKTTIDSIARFSTKLKTFYLFNPGRKFLIAEGDQDILTLMNVTDFLIQYDKPMELIGDLSFAMPSLTMLRLCGMDIDPSIIDFINRFETLENFEIIFKDFGDLKTALFIRDFNRALEESTWAQWDQGCLGTTRIFLYKRKGAEQKAKKRTSFISDFFSLPSGIFENIIQDVRKFPII